VLALRRSTRRRFREGLMIAEGERLLAELAASSLRPVEVFCTSVYGASGSEARSLIGRLASDAEVVEVADAVMAEMADTATPQGILAVVPIPLLLQGPDPQLIVIPDQVRDPGNLGTILRAAWAAGATQVLVPPGTVDFTSPKVVRAGMGAHFHVPIRHAGWEAIWACLGSAKLWVAEAHRGSPYWDVDWRHDVALVIGGEAAGPSAEPHNEAQYVHIPMPGGAESLNAAVAAGVLMFEVARQRACLRS
jgi:TrmH family RNA methyltransferase